MGEVHLDTTFTVDLIFASADCVVYLSLFSFLVKSFKLHRFRVVAFLVLIAPFIYPLFYTGDLFSILWMLIFTILRVLVMVSVYPVSMGIYYVISGGVFCGFIRVEEEISFEKMIV